MNLTDKQRRGMCLINAYLSHHAKKIPDKPREFGVWLYLILWASLGGKTRDVPAEFGGKG